jgi:hypothetical protein
LLLATRAGRLHTRMLPLRRRYYRRSRTIERMMPLKELRS